MFRRSLIAFACFCALPAWAAPTHLVILHTNDTHNHLLPFNTKQQPSMGGVARRSTLIQQIRNQEGALVFDAGDAFQGTPSYTYFKGEADYLVLKAMGYDATTLGNHELDDGLDNLQKQLTKSGMTLINSNLLKGDKPIFVPSKIYNLHGIRVGVFGLMGEDAIGTVANKNRIGITYLSTADVARKMIPELRKQADMVVCLTHNGYMEDKQLAKDVAGIDVIIGGHSHTILKEAEAIKNGNHTTYIVQTGQWGENLGRIDLDVEGGKVLNLKERLLPVDATATPDAKIAQLVDKYEAQLKAKMNEVIGQTPVELSVQDKYQRQCPLGSWATDRMREVTSTDVAILNTGGIRAAIPQGPITIGTVYTAFPFDNQVITLDMKGDVLQQVLDHNIHQLSEKGLMLQVSGMTWSVKDNKATALVAGKPLDPNKVYSIATIDYIAQGNDSQGPFTKATNYRSSGRFLRDTLLEYLKAHPQVVVPTDVRFTR